MALRFGIEVPEYYELGYGADMSKTMERILGDLEATLPAVLARVTLDDLAAVEKAELGGANLHAMAQAGKEYMQYFEISQLQL